MSAAQLAEIGFESFDWVSDYWYCSEIMPRLEDNDAKSLNALNTVIPETKRVNPKYKKPLKRPNPD